MNSSRFMYLVCMILFVSAAFISCRDLESVIDESRKKPSSYGKDLYWQGYHVGSTFKTSFDERFKLNSVLVRDGLWIEKSVVIPGYDRAYFDSQGNKKTEWVPEKTVHTYMDATRVKNIGGQDILYIVTMEVPVDPESRTMYYFVYDIKAAKMRPAGISGASTVTTEMEKLLPPDLAPYRKAQGEGLDPFTDFEDRKKITLELGSDKHQSVFYVAAGTDLYVYKGISDTAIVDKADTRLNQHVDPLLIGWVSGDISWRNVFLKGDFRYALMDTGSMKSGREAAEALGGAKGGYLYDLAAGFHGIETKVTVQKWNFGRSDYYTSSVQGSRDRNVFVSSDDFVLEKRQVDLLYHFAWKDIPRLGGAARNQKMNDYYLGYRFMSYDRPGIAYRYETVKNEYTGDDEMVVRGESPPQILRVSGHCLGFGLNNFLKSSAPGLHLLYSAYLYAGYAYTRADVVARYG
ncbi:MAG: hypothetical protein ACRCUT_03300, partial [Spirochaetota bacterium]